MSEESTSVFGSDIFSQAAQIAKEEGITLGGESKPELAPIEKEDVEPLVELPFFAASIMTKISELELEDKEREKLTRLWHRIIMKYGSKYEHLDIGLAVSATAVIFVEKYLIYQGVMEDRRQAKLVKDKEKIHAMGD